MRSTPLPLLALLLLPFAVQAQEYREIRVGDPLFAVAHLTEHRDTLDLFVRRGVADRPVSMLVRSVQLGVVNGETAWRFVQEYQSPQGASQDISWVLAGSLAPVTYHATVPGEVHRFEFDSAEVKGTVTLTDSAARRLSFEQPAPSFNAVADQLLLPALPLAVGFAARYRAFNPPRGFATVRIRVVGDTLLSTRAGPVDVWVVAYDAGAAPTVLWVGKDSGWIIRSRSVLGDGSEFWRVAR